MVRKETLVREVAEEHPDLLDRLDMRDIPVVWVFREFLAHPANLGPLRLPGTPERKVNLVLLV